MSLVPVTEGEEVLICGRKFFDCVCVVPAQNEHDDHICKCGGSWCGTPGEEQVLELPEQFMGWLFGGPGE